MRGLPANPLHLWLVSLVFLALVGGLSATVMLSDTPPPPPPPVYPTPAPEPTRTWPEEQEFRRKELEEMKQGGIVPDPGPETGGRLITIAGKGIQLLPDVFVEGVAEHIQCFWDKPCPETPFYGLRRGKSVVWVSIPSGTISYEQIEPGEEGAFDFLKEALR